MDISSDKYFQERANFIIGKLNEPQNRDLLFAVVAHGVKPGSQDSFMLTFKKPSTMGFDEFSMIRHNLDTIIPKICESMGVPYNGDLRSMSQRYDEYLLRQDTAFALDDDQSARYDAIINEADDSGWSGSVYGLVMRLVQTTLLRMLNN